MQPELQLEPDVRKQIDILEFPESENIAQKLKDGENGDILGLFAPPGAGCTSLIQTAIRGQDCKHLIFSCVGEDTANRTLIALLIALGPRSRRDLERLPRRVIIDEIAAAISLKGIQILVIEHMELEELSLGRYLVAVRDCVLAAGAPLKIIAHYTMLDGKRKLLGDPDLRASFVHSISIGVPSPSKASSVFMHHLAQRKEFLALAARKHPEVIRALKLIYAVSDADLRRITALARKLNFYYGDHPIDAPYLALIEELL